MRENNNQSDTFHSEIFASLYNKAMLPERNREKPLRRAQLKLLDLIALLNDHGRMGSPEGIVALAQGIVNPETLAFKEAESFGSLTSYSGKRLKGLLRLLVQKGYLSQAYSAAEEDYFFLISAQGRAALTPYRAHPHKKKVVVRPSPKKTIIPLIIKEKNT